MSQFDSGTKLSKAFLSENIVRTKTDNGNKLSTYIRRPDEPRSSGDANEQHQVLFNSQDDDDDESSPGHKLRKRLNECCYSVANLALIVASIAAIIVLVKFYNDDPLYEYGEYIISLAFYRQLIYVIVIVPLVFLVPIFNALSACFRWRGAHSPSEICAPHIDQQSEPQRAAEAQAAKQKLERQAANRRSLVLIKLVFELLLIILLFIALVFIGPYVRVQPLKSQIELELRKHMQRRYDGTFSYNFMDTLQLEYQCCDESWYKSNLPKGYLPISCFMPNSVYTVTFKRTCSDVIGSLLAARCAVLAACLVVLLVALALLVAIDLFHWFEFKAAATQARYKGGHRYEFVTSDARRANMQAARIVRPAEASSDEDEGLGDTPGSSSLCANDDELLKPSEIVSRLKLNERDKQELVSNSPVHFEHVKQDSGGEETRPSSAQHQSRSREVHRASPTILTRANYVTVRRERSESPAYLDSLDEDANRRQCQKRPIKSVLKKTSSFQRIDDHDDQVEPSAKRDVEEDGESLEDYAQKLRKNTSSLLRHEQTRRSLLNVRFADTGQ